jgi:predicted transcriptional regulator
MGFEIFVVGNTPLTDVEDKDIVALTFLENIGYISKGGPSRSGSGSQKDSIAFNLFMNCLLEDQSREWKVEDLSKNLKTSVPTIYRHLSKLKALEIIDEDTGDKGKVFHLKHYSFPLAWMVTEANIRAALEKYSAVVDHLQKEQKKVERRTATDSREPMKNFRLRIAADRMDLKAGTDTLLVQFLSNIGYFSEHGEEEVMDSIAFKMFKNCFLKRSERFWTVDELKAFLKTTRPTVYRHLNKLEGLGILEHTNIGKQATGKKGHRIRHGSLSRAWRFVEAYTKVAVDNYRLTVEHLNKLVEK